MAASASYGERLFNRSELAAGKKWEFHLRDRVANFVMASTQSLQIMYEVSPSQCPRNCGTGFNKRIIPIVPSRLEKPNTFRKPMLMLFGLGTLLCPLALGMLHTLPACGQVLYTSGPLPSFEVASIRPMPDGYSSTSPHGGNIVRLHFTPKMMVGYAYNLPDFAVGRILNAPGWTEDNYEIQGKIGDSDYAAMQKMTPEEKNRQIQLMVQSLLKDRMQLKVHLEKREETVYALEVAKGGMKLAPAKEGMPKRFDLTHHGQNYQLTDNGGNLYGFAELLGREPEIGGRSVVNKTGITGSYDLALHWTRTGSTAAVTDDASTQDENGPSFFTAIQEQLGLRLAATKDQVDYVIVDHIEKPSAN
jgi:bla regulator protein BlaR1